MTHLDVGLVDGAVQPHLVSLKVIYISLVTCDVIS